MGRLAPFGEVASLSNRAIAVGELVGKEGHPCLAMQMASVNAHRSNGEGAGSAFRSWLLRG